jgi:hypothetical protein
MAGTPALDPFEGDVDKAIRTLRQIPPYQIDVDHGHCGPRETLLAALDILQKYMPGVAVCWACWDSRRLEVRWQGAKKPLVCTPLSGNWTSTRGGWRAFPIAVELGTERCAELHNRARDLFLAKEKSWERRA